MVRHTLLIAVCGASLDQARLALGIDGGQQEFFDVEDRVFGGAFQKVRGPFVFDAQAQGSGIGNGRCEGGRLRWGYCGGCGWVCATSYGRRKAT